MKYRQMSDEVKRQVVAAEMSRLAASNPVVSAERWDAQRDRTLGIPCYRTVALLFNAASWPKARERIARMGDGGDWAAEALAAGLPSECPAEVREPRQYRGKIDTEEAAAIIEEMGRNAAPRDWDVRPLRVVASEQAQPYSYYDTTLMRRVATVRRVGRFENA